MREPTGLEQAARTYIERTGAADYLFSGLMDNDLRSHLEEIALTFPDTSYGDYANLILGEYLAREDDDRARIYLPAGATRRDFPLAHRAAQALARFQRK